MNRVRRLGLSRLVVVEDSPKRAGLIRPDGDEGAPPEADRRWGITRSVPYLIVLWLVALSVLVAPVCFVVLHAFGGLSWVWELNAATLVGALLVFLIAAAAWVKAAGWLVQLTRQWAAARQYFSANGD